MRTFRRPALIAAACGLTLIVAGCTSVGGSAGSVTASAPASAAASGASTASSAPGSAPGSLARSPGTSNSAAPGTGSAAGTASAAASSTAAPASGSAATGTASRSVPAPVHELEQAFTSISAAVLPSVVEISTGRALGSGIVFDDAGHIVTNDHVVGNSKTFTVRLSDGHAYRASLTGAYPEGDLAVIQIHGATHLRPATFGDSSHLKIGDIVLAVGNPLGLEGSVTEGIVSAVGRVMTEPSGPDSPGATLPNTIQTSAPINPGNSGGALVDLAGEVVGIPTLAATDQQQGGAAPGIGFAIPSNVVTDIAQQLVRYGEVRNSHRAALGVQVTTVFDQQTGAPGGAGVVAVTKGGPAAKAGIKPGQVIVSVHGVKTPTTAALSQALAELKPGQQVKVGVVASDGSQHTVTVTLGQLTGG